MVGAILVATQADRALGDGRGFVTRMTERARLMFWLGMQAGKVATPMTARARRHTRDSRWTVGTVAGLTTRVDPAVRALLLRAMTVSANLLRRQADVRLMAIRAELVPLR